MLRAYVDNSSQWGAWTGRRGLKPEKVIIYTSLNLEKYLVRLGDNYLFPSKLQSSFIYESNFKELVIVTRLAENKIERYSLSLVYSVITTVMALYLPHIDIIFVIVLYFFEWKTIDKFEISP